MQELLNNVRFQIGKGPLHILVDEICEFEQESERKNCIIYLTAFRIAHLDENQNIIAGKVVEFKDENAPRIARMLAFILWDIAKDTISLPVYLDEYSVSFDQLKNGDIRISRNKQEVVVPLGDVSELGGKLAIIVGSTRHKSIGQK